MADKWEYKVFLVFEVDRLDEKQLNQLGAEGWELAGVVTDVTGESGMQLSTGRIHTWVRLIFKRRKP